jgi:nicotinate-nucleotide adenylyltransferase
MAAIATLEDARIRLSSIELEAPDKPYTFETLSRLRERYEPDTKLFFLMGADSFLELNTWREPERLLKEANIVVAARPGAEIRWDHLEEPLASGVRDVRRLSSTTGGDLGSNENVILLTELVWQDVSATDIRERVRAEESIKGLVPEPVAAYINKYELYRR